MRHRSSLARVAAALRAHSNQASGRPRMMPSSCLRPQPVRGCRQGRSGEPRQANPILGVPRPTLGAAHARMRELLFVSQWMAALSAWALAVPRAADQVLFTSEDNTGLKKKVFSGETAAPSATRPGPNRTRIDSPRTADARSDARSSLPFLYSRRRGRAPARSTQAAPTREGRHRKACVLMRCPADGNLQNATALESMLRARAVPATRDLIILILGWTNGGAQITMR